MAEVVAAMAAIYVGVRCVVVVRSVAVRVVMAVVRGAGRVLSVAALRPGSVLLEVDRDGAIWLVARPVCGRCEDARR